MSNMNIEAKKSVLRNKYINPDIKLAEGLLGNERWTKAIEIALEKLKKMNNDAYLKDPIIVRMLKEWNTSNNSIIKRINNRIIEINSGISHKDERYADVADVASSSTEQIRNDIRRLSRRKNFLFSTPEKQIHPYEPPIFKERSNRNMPVNVPPRETFLFPAVKNKPHNNPDAPPPRPYAPAAKLTSKNIHGQRVWYWSGMDLSPQSRKNTPSSTGTVRTGPGSPFTPNHKYYIFRTNKKNNTNNNYNSKRKQLFPPNKE